MNLLDPYSLVVTLLLTRNPHMASELASRLPHSSQMP